ncbi:MAG TPA: hypothetical protein DCW68_07650 [Rhodospirillaceae bacterium]|nr:MAG: hypothetical protein A2018_08130 [Alphaproteobacteria bacterium GWF2_58_20]HAU29961.1 hypothetical protein [Rhodospirillaceae bacterium]
MTTEFKQPPCLPQEQAEDEMPSHKELAARKSLRFMEQFIRENPDMYAVSPDADEATSTRQVMDNILRQEETRLEQGWGDKTRARRVRRLAWAGFFAVGGAGIAMLPVMPWLAGVAAIANAALFFKHLCQESLLAEAVENREEFEIRRLLAEGVNPNCPVHGAFGPVVAVENPMPGAFKETDNKIAKLLLENGFNPNVRSVFRHRLNPLQTAMKDLDSDRVAMLLHHGATVGLFSTTGSDLGQLVTELQKSKNPDAARKPFFDILGMLLEQAGSQASHEGWRREMRLMERTLADMKDHPFLPDIRKRLMQAMSQRAAKLPVRLPRQLPAPQPKQP